jgi:hypothetical protein
MRKHNPIYLVLIMTLLASLSCSIETSPPAPTAELVQQPTLEPSPTLAPPTPFPTLPPTNTATPAATPTLVVQAGASDADLESKGFIDSGDNKLRVIGKLPIVLNLKALVVPPTAPAGWEFIGPVFDITAQGKVDRKPIQKLAQALVLRFQAPRGRPVTIMVNGEKGWEIVPSEFDAEGNITASVDHLTPYGVGSPTQSKITPTAKPTLRVTATRTQSAATTRTPQATVVTTTVSSSVAETALSDGVKVLKAAKAVKITAASGYTGVVSVALPASLQKTLSSVSASGTVYYGMYNGVNEAVTAQAKTGNTVTGAMTLAIEPKTSMPATADDAKKQLQTYFPGVTATLTQAQPSSADTKGYVFYGTSGTTAFSLGYVSYNGVALAYAMSGSGTYQSLVPKN